MREDDRNYYQRRSEEEQIAVELATDPQSAMVHPALAARYHQLSRGAAELPLQVISKPGPMSAPHT